MFRSSSVGQRPTSSVPPGTRSQLQNGAVQRGLGALPSTSKMDASPGGGASIFGMMGPSCPACLVSPPQKLHPKRGRHFFGALCGSLYNNGILAVLYFVLS